MSDVRGAMKAARIAAGEDGRLVGVIGSPIAHSLSPVLHAAAFEALGLPEWSSRAYEVPTGHADDALVGMRAAGMTGLSVTMPHKNDVAALVDDLSPVARQLGAVNCVVQGDGDALFGVNTDGEGFVASLRRGADYEAKDKRCLVLGAGGAARAVILALAAAGAAQVAVMNRTTARAEVAAELAGSSGRVATVGDSGVVAEADLVVNATPLGMAGSGDPSEWLVAPDQLHPGQVAADLVYVPRPTEWLQAAAKVGATTVDGLGMLVHQAAAQIELWTGVPAPVEAMWKAVADEAD